MFKRMIVSTLSISVLVYVGFAAYLFAQQRSFLYFPTPEAPIIADAERFTLYSDDEALQIWKINPGQGKALIYFGGNAEAVENNVAGFSRQFPDRTIYLVNYRGFGGSTGTPTEDGLYADALALYDHIRAEHDRVDLIGRSLGSGVATYVAAERQVERLVLVTPYDSIERIARRAYPLFPIGLLLVDKFNSLERVAAIRADTLILLAEQDVVIPKENSLRLAQAFPPEQVQISIISQSDHNTIDNRPDYLTYMRSFLAD